MMLVTACSSFVKGKLKGQAAAKGKDPTEFWLGCGVKLSISRGSFAIVVNPVVECQRLISKFHLAILFQVVSYSQLGSQH